MRYKFTTEEYEKIEQLVNYALCAPNKAKAKQYTQQLYYIGNDLCGAANNILHELIAAMDAASGQVQDKERLKYFAEMSLYKLQSFIEEDKLNA